MFGRVSDNGTAYVEYGTAAEAKEIGLIGHVVPDGPALAKAREIADVICENGPLSVVAESPTAPAAGIRRSRKNAATPLNAATSARACERTGRADPPPIPPHRCG